MGLLKSWSDVSELVGAGPSVGRGREYKYLSGKASENGGDDESESLTKPLSV